MLISKIIVEDSKGICICSNFVKTLCSEQEIRACFDKVDLPIASIQTDQHGCALVKIDKAVSNLMPIPQPCDLLN